MNKEIIAYKLVGGFNSDDLVKYITEHIKDGWQPYEQPFLILDELVQPMVQFKKYDLDSYKLTDPSLFNMPYEDQ